jgi:hypothetical protein
MLSVTRLSANSNLDVRLTDVAQLAENLKIFNYGFTAQTPRNDMIYMQQGTCLRTCAAKSAFGAVAHQDNRTLAQIGGTTRAPSSAR